VKIDIRKIVAKITFDVAIKTTIVGTLALSFTYTVVNKITNVEQHFETKWDLQEGWAEGVDSALAALLARPALTRVDTIRDPVLVETTIIERHDTTMVYGYIIVEDLGGDLRILPMAPFPDSSVVDQIRRHYLRIPPWPGGTKYETRRDTIR
jgi:hypothetical protein